MKFNINDWVKVKLTPYGKRVLMERNSLMVKVDNEGKTLFEFWLLLTIFRDYWYPTAEAVIEENIEIIDRTQGREENKECAR